MMDLATIADQTVDRCESTNDLARKLGESGYPSGTWVSARIQDRGRGRLGRDWVSSEGNLFLSMVLRFPTMRQWTWVPLAVAVASASAVMRKLPKIEISIKWPNDLWINGAKLGGVLCEGVGNSEGSFIIAGVGINCTVFPTAIDQKAISLSEHLQTNVTAEQIRGDVVAAIRETAELFNRDSETAIRATQEFYHAHAAFPPGSTIQWGGAQRAKVVGLGSFGELEVVTPEGEQKKLFAEDIFQGVS
jgi:BirA family transcriptional regulator, biotin operon repressor / biotin---[acetyl-CoA-carboxylase] ligase